MTIGAALDSELLASSGVPTDGDRPRVFLSYAYQDREVADQIAGNLSSRGIDVWTDRQIALGESLASAIATKIEEADAVVVLMSPASAKSQAVNTEVALTIANTFGDPNKRVLPVLIDGDPSDVVPPLLSDRLRLDLRGKVADPHSLDVLVEAVSGAARVDDTQYEKAQVLTQLQTDAFRHKVQQQVAIESAKTSAALRRILTTLGVLLVLSFAVMAVVLGFNAEWGALADQTFTLIVGVATGFFLERVGRREKRRVSAKKPNK